MRQSSMQNNPLQDLLIRNQKLVLELNKLQNENRLLRKKISSLHIVNLQLKKSYRLDKCTQTDYLENINNNEVSNLHSNLHLKSDHLSIDVIENDIIGKPTNIIQSENVDEFDYEFITVKPSRRSSIFNVRNLLRSPDNELLSPTKKKVTNHLSSHLSLPNISSLSIENKILNDHNDNNKENRINYNHVNNSLNVHTDLNLSYENNNDYHHVNTNVIDHNSNTDDSNTRTTIVMNKRTPRSTKKPLSYQETSLNVKVRKGFQFFKFA